MSRENRAMAVVRGVVLAAGLLVLVLGLVSMLAVSFAGSQVVDQIERSFALPSGHSIDVRGRNGTIEYMAWDGTEVVIRATKETGGLIPWISRWLAGSVKVEISQDGTGVRAAERGPLGMILGNVTVRYEIRVPRGWSGTVSLRTSNGTITARDVHGEIDLRTSNGPVIVEGQSGSLRAHTSNGRIELANVDGVVEAESSNGAIRIERSTLTGAGSVRTSNGAIHINAKLADAAAYTARTSNGRVTLVLIEPDVAVDLRTSNGTIDLDTPVTVSSIGRNSVEGRIGDGASRLDVRTSNGNISLSVAGSLATVD